METKLKCTEALSQTVPRTIEPILSKFQAQKTLWMVTKPQPNSRYR